MTSLDSSVVDASASVLFDASLGTYTEYWSLPLEITKQTSKSLSHFNKTICNRPRTDDVFYRNARKVLKSIVDDENSVILLTVTTLSVQNITYNLKLLETNNKLSYDSTILQNVTLASPSVYFLNLSQSDNSHPLVEVSLVSNDSLCATVSFQPFVVSS